MNNPKKILLTGASGTVGLHVLRQLVYGTNKYDITLFDIRTKISQANLAPYKSHAKIVYGDIGNIDEIEKACVDQDIVIHLAAIIPPLADEQPNLAYRVNVTGTKNLITCLQRYSPTAFLLYGSSISVYGDRLKNPWIKVGDALVPSVGDDYAKTKIEAEKIVKESTLAWCIFRLTAIMGINNHKISKLLFHMPLNTPIEILTPEDAARAFIKAIQLN